MGLGVVGRAFGGLSRRCVVCLVGGFEDVGFRGCWFRSVYVCEDVRVDREVRWPSQNFIP